MTKVNVHEAKTHLSRHLEDLEAGRVTSVVICRRNVPIAELRAVTQARRKKRPIGLAKGKVFIPKSFFEPLPDEILDAFYGKR
jgi:antitoxin (DNA-binding transcriptional repressor) of toxin-antitoxin stability system